MIRSCRTVVLGVRCHASAACLFGGLAIFLASPATAQEESDNPLRFLKPWIERQLFGRETSEPGGPEDSVPAAPAEAAPAAGETVPDPAASPEGVANTP